MAVEALMPSVETVTVKRGGASYQVPVPMHEPRQVLMAIRWFLEAAQTRVDKDKVPGMAEAIALEALHVLSDRELEASSRSGVVLTSYAVPKRRALHRVAKASRVHAHRRWR